MKCDWCYFLHLFILDLFVCLFYLLIFTLTGEEKQITYKEWEDKIQTHFEAQFFIGATTSLTNVHKRNIYKDTHGSSHDYLDHQLRPNFPIAICAVSNIYFFSMEYC